jgi:hypothetical protein
MQKGPSHNLGVSATLTLGLALASLVLMLPRRLTAASNDQVITCAGQKVSSIFEGLKPNHFLPASDTERHKGRRQWLDERAFGGYMGAHFVLAQCSQCSPDTPCAGHYEAFHASTGCTDPVGCPSLENAYTNTTSAPYSSGSYDSYCGVDCCYDAQQCDNP